MEPYLGATSIFCSTDDDGIVTQKRANCNPYGSLKVFPDVCLEPLSAKITIPNETVWESPVIEIYDARWDIDFYLEHVVGANITEINFIYIPDIEYPDINEIITITDVIGAGDVAAYHGYTMKKFGVLNSVEEHVWAHQAIKITIEVTAGVDAQVQPLLKLTPRT